MRQSEADSSIRLPLRELLLTLIRWAPVVLLAAFVAAALLYLATNEEAVPEATARVGNTDDVRWPQDDVVRDLVVGHLDDPDVLDEIRSGLEAPAALIEIDSNIPPNQAYVEVVARAEDEQTARQAATAAARVIVSIENLRITAANLASKETIEARLSEFDTRIGELDTEIQRLADIEGTAYSTFLDGNEAEDRAAWQVAEANLGAAETSRAQETWRRNDVLRELDQVELSLSNSEATVVVSRDAQIEEDTGQAGVLPAVLAGLAAAVVAGLAAVAIDRTTGRARSASRVAANAGRHTFDLGDSQSTADFVLDAAVRSSGEAIAVFSPDSAARAASVLADGLHVTELVSLGGETGNAADVIHRREQLKQRLANGGVIQLGRATERVGDLILAASLTSVGYLAVDKHTKMRELRRAIDAIESRGTTLVALVYSESGELLELTPSLHADVAG